MAWIWLQLGFASLVLSGTASSSSPRAREAQATTQEGPTRWPCETIGTAGWPSVPSASITGGSGTNPLVQIGDLPFDVRKFLLAHLAEFASAYRRKPFKTNSCGKRNLLADALDKPYDMGLLNLPLTEFSRLLSRLKKQL